MTATALASHLPRPVMINYELLLDCRSSRKQAVKYANFCNLVLHRFAQSLPDRASVLFMIEARKAA